MKKCQLMHEYIEYIKLDKLYKLDAETQIFVFIYYIAYPFIDMLIVGLKLQPAKPVFTH